MVQCNIYIVLDEIRPMKKKITYNASEVDVKFNVHLTSPIKAMLTTNDFHCQPENKFITIFHNLLESYSWIVNASVLGRIENCNEHDRNVPFCIICIYLRSSNAHHIFCDTKMFITKKSVWMVVLFVEYFSLLPYYISHAIEHRTCVVSMFFLSLSWVLSHHRLLAMHAWFEVVVLRFNSLMLWHSYLFQRNPPIECRWECYQVDDERMDPVQRNALEAVP